MEALPVCAWFPWNQAGFRVHFVSLRQQLGVQEKLGPCPTPGDGAGTMLVCAISALHCLVRDFSWTWGAHPCPHAIGDRAGCGLGSPDTVREGLTPAPDPTLPVCTLSLGVAECLPAPARDAASPPRWAWVLQDALGIAFCLYMLRTIRLHTFKVRHLDAAGQWLPRSWTPGPAQCLPGPAPGTPGPAPFQLLQAPPSSGPAPGTPGPWPRPAPQAPPLTRTAALPAVLHAPVARALPLRRLLCLHHTLPDQGGCSPHVVLPQAPPHSPHPPCPACAPVPMPRCRLVCRVGTALW